MRRLAVVLLAVFPLGGCDRIDTLDIEVRSERDVLLHVASGRCIDHLEIGTSEMNNTILWKIERVPGMRPTCPRDVTFPQAPAGYRASITADRLPKGQYAISGMAQGYALAGHFDVPPR